MSNELTIQGQRPDYLPALPTDGGPSRFTSGISAGGLALPRLSFRGKVFRIRKNGEEASIGNGPLRVILVDAREPVSKAYYEKAYTPGETTPPRCYAEDGMHPRSGEEGKGPIAATCAQCPMNQWGSAMRNGVPTKGKACSDTKRLVVFPILDLPNGSKLVQPVILDLPATSMRAKKGTQPAFYEYVRTLEQAGVDPQTYVAELTFSDEEHPRLVWQPVRYATAEEYAHVREAAESPDTAEAISTEGGGVHDSAMKTQGTPPAAEPPKEEPKPKPAPEPEPPKEEAKPAEAKPSDDDAKAVMDELSRLLSGE